MKHAVREPKRQTREPVPVLLLLHGLRSNEQDLIQLAPMIDERLFVVSVRAPIQMGRGAYAWYNVEFVPGGFHINPEEAERSRIGILDFVKEVVNTYNVDAGRVFIGGFSQGAAMSVACSLSAPRLFTGAIAMSGRFIDELRGTIAPTGQLAGLPMQQVHGTRDSVIPIEHGRELRDELLGLPVRLTHREYDMAHEVTPESIRDVSRWISDRLDEADWRTGA